jgi:hypothetical protein
VYKNLICDNIEHEAIKSLLRNLNTALFGNGSGTVSSVTSDDAPPLLLHADASLERLMAQFHAPALTDDVEN